MITLYACKGSGNCFKPFLVLKQLHIPFRTILLDVITRETRSADYLAINPSGTVPYLRLADGRGLGESNAMLWYLAGGSHLIPTDQYDHAQALQWMFFEQSSLEPFISPARFFIEIAPEQRAARERDIVVWQDRARKGLNVLNEHLMGRKFLIGDRYSVADISVYGYVHLAGGACLDLKAYPAIHNWIEQVEGTEGFVPLASLEATVDPSSQKSLGEAA